MNTMVSLRKSAAHQTHLVAEVQRILAESKDMLAEVRSRRESVEAAIASLRAYEIEAVIAKAYQGKRRAEAQLRRTQLSRTEVLKAFDAAPHGRSLGPAEAGRHAGLLHE